MQIHVFKVLEHLPEEHLCYGDVELASFMVGSSNDQVSKVGDTVFFIDALVVELGEAVLGTEKELAADQARPAQGM